MGKVLMLSLGGLGVGGVGASGLLILKPWASKSVTFSDKYKYAILDTSKDNSVWNNKYGSLKANKPKHPKLVLAYAEAIKTVSPNETEAKRLMREGCRDIYESSFENSEYKGDFKNYCSKTNSEESSNQTWNDMDTVSSSSNKWDISLQSLRDHDVSQKGGLVLALSKLKGTLTGKSTFEKTYRDSLKGWCDEVKKEPFTGKDSLEFKNQELYCKGS